MICERCNKIYVRGKRKKGTRRNNSKICPDCKKGKCIICHKIMIKKTKLQKTCSVRCRKIHEKRQREEYNKKDEENKKEK